MEALLRDSVLPLLCRPLFKHEPWMDWAALAAISLPHFLYAWVWFCPQAWKSMCGKQAVQAFALISSFLKLVQFETATLWFWSSRSQGLCLDPSTIHLWQWMAFLLLVAFGQKLNIGIYQAIGVNGVYYGYKLGKKVPWVTGFPFNIVSHPQYVGSVMTVWGMATLLYSQAPAGSPLQASLVLLSAFWTLLYVITGCIEQFF